MINKALIMAGTHNDIGLISAIKQLGYYTICIGSIVGLPGQKMCDEYHQIDYTNIDDVLEFAKKNNVTNVIPSCNDSACITASYVDEMLGINNLDTYENISMLHNKDQFKKFIRDFDIDSPLSYSFDNFKQAKDYLLNVDNVSIVKPVDSSGGKGVSICKNKCDIDNILNKAFNSSKSGKIVIEEFIDGPQFGYCAFLINKKVIIVCTNNEYSFENMYRVEIDTFPSTNYKLVEKTLNRFIENVANDLELKDGIFHIQYKFKDGKPYIIEVMRRIIGNLYHIPGNALNGCDWNYLQAKAYIGEDFSNLNLKNIQNGYYAYKTLFAKRNGKINSIEVPEKYLPYCFEKYLIKNSGDNVDDYNKEQIGFLFFRFQDYDSMHKLLIEEYNNDIVKI